MKKEVVELAEKKLVGVTIRTNTKNEFNPETAQIKPCIDRYEQQQVAHKTPHRKFPGKVFCAYTSYESDHTGDYTYFIGEEVDRIETLPEGLKSLTIPAQAYVKLTTNPGPMPHVVIDAWQKIWAMSSEELGGKRSYITDFEVYDERAQDPQNTVVDIYIGVRGHPKEGSVENALKPNIYR